MNNFDNLMKENKAMFQNWLNDKTIAEAYNKEDLQQEFLKCIQLAIESNFVIKTELQVQETMVRYHRDQEGLY